MSGAPLIAWREQCKKENGHQALPGLPPAGQGFIFQSSSYQRHSTLRECATGMRHRRRLGIRSLDAEPVIGRALRGPGGIAPE